jgi:hypothetical protein
MMGRDSWEEGTGVVSDEKERAGKGWAGCGRAPTAIHTPPPLYTHLGVFPHAALDLDADHGGDGYGRTARLTECMCVRATARVCSSERRRRRRSGVFLRRRWQAARRQSLDKATLAHACVRPLTPAVVGVVCGVCVCCESAERAAPRRAQQWAQARRQRAQEKSAAAPGTVSVGAHTPDVQAAVG